MQDIHSNQLIDTLKELISEIKHFREDFNLGIYKTLAEIEGSIKVLNHQNKEIMSAISDFSAAQAAFQDRQDKAITNLQADVENLEAQIKKLQDSTGQITPEDQKLLDDIQTRSSAISDKLDALDALTPPVVPPVENPPPTTGEVPLA